MILQERTSNKTVKVAEGSRKELVVKFMDRAARLSQEGFKSGHTSFHYGGIATEFSSPDGKQFLTLELLGEEEDGSAVPNPVPEPVLVDAEAKEVPNDEVHKI